MLRTGIHRHICGTVHLVAPGLVSMMLHCVSVNIVVLVGLTGMHKTGCSALVWSALLWTALLCSALERQDLPCMYPAHHEPENVKIVVVINIIIIIIITIPIIIIIVTVIITGAQLTGTMSDVKLCSCKVNSLSLQQHTLVAAPVMLQSCMHQCYD